LFLYTPPDFFVYFTRNPEFSRYRLKADCNEGETEKNTTLTFSVTGKANPYSGQNFGVFPLE